jgi:hypothetical protein
MKICSFNNSKTAFLASLGILAASSASLSAVVVYSGVVDIPISTNLSGVYLDLATSGTSTPGNGADVVTPDSYAIGYSEPATWDVNFFLGGIGIGYSPTFQPFVDDAVGNRSQVVNVAVDLGISSEAVSRTIGGDVSDGVYGGSGRSNGGVGESHFDTPAIDSNPNYSVFTPGAPGYIAFVLNPGAGEQYGWMKVTLTNDGTAGTIHEWAYSDQTAFKVAAIPEPSSTTLCGGFAVLCLLHRRRKLR